MDADEWPGGIAAAVMVNTARRFGGVVRADH